MAFIKHGDVKMGSVLTDELTDEQKKEVEELSKKVKKALDDSELNKTAGDN